MIAELFFCKRMIKIIFQVGVVDFDFLFSAQNVANVKAFWQACSILSASVSSPMLVKKILKSDGQPPKFGKIFDAVIRDVTNFNAEIFQIAQKWSHSAEKWATRNNFVTDFNDIHNRCRNCPMPDENPWKRIMPAYPAVKTVIFCISSSAKFMTSSGIFVFTITASNHIVKVKFQLTELRELTEIFNGGKFFINANHHFSSRKINFSSRFGKSRFWAKPAQRVSCRAVRCSIKTFAIVNRSRSSKILSKSYMFSARRFLESFSMRLIFAVAKFRKLWWRIFEDNRPQRHSSRKDFSKWFFLAKFFRSALIKIFKTLDTKISDHAPYLKKIWKKFPYVNGNLFSEEIEIPNFNDEIKFFLLEYAGRNFDWSGISSTIYFWTTCAKN